MIKKIISLLGILVLITACSNDMTTDRVKNQQYQSYLSSILNQDRFITATFAKEDAVLAGDSFDIKADMQKNEDETYTYSVVIDNPHQALYNIEAVILDESIEDPAIMMPSAGVWEDMEYNFIPYQIRPDKGYMEGIRLQGDTNDSEVVLKMLVIWRDSSRLNIKQQFYELALQTLETATPPTPSQP